jgi:hypothetical protein
MPPASNVVDFGDHRPPEHDQAVAKAMAWLTDRHRKGWTNAFTATLAEFAPERSPDLSELDEEAGHAILINVGEWLLARGRIHARGGLQDINAYLLGPSGPALSAGEARWIAQLRERPLRLYRVTDVRPGEGLTLVDALDDQAAPVEVRERAGSRNARPGMVLGVRLMDCGDHLELSGAIYPFAMLREPALLDALRAIAGADPQAARPDIELEIARRWLVQFSEPPPLPEMRDAATGEPLLLVTDHYRVHDAAALAAALATQPDVQGDAQHGWSRNVDGGGGLQRSLLAINPGRSADRIELFARTQRLADDGRAWFEALAGAAVEHLTREVNDPRSPQALAAAADRRPAAPPDIDPQQLGEIISQALRSAYANWADEPIPALGGKTPRQAIATPAGLERVKGLLRQYEAGEAEQARAQGRPEVSFQFLWDALGIAR